MTTVTIFNRVTKSKPSRIKITNVQIEKEVVLFKETVARNLETEEIGIELLYGGQVLKDGESLSLYGIKPGVTIHVMKKVEIPPEQEPEKMNQAAMQQVVTALQTALINPAYRNIVEKMLSNPETLENLITATPGLEKDPIAMAMLQDPELLAMLADPKLINNVIEAHPSLGQAATFVAAAVSEEAAKDRGMGGRFVGRGHYSMDQMSDEDDMDVDNPSGRPVGFSPSGAPITANQLGAALAALAGEVGGGGGGSGGSGASSSGAGASSITTDFFRQAMAAARTDQGTSSQPRPVSESELQQLREMGITDESVARRALEASGGDVQAALEIIFGNGL